MADRARSRLPVLAMLLALAGGAFWWYDGLVLLEPLLGGSGLDLAALRSAKAGSRERAASDERPERSPASTPDGPAADADDPTGELDLLARFGSWTGERLSRQVFLPSRPRLDDDDLAALGLPPSDASGEAAGPSGRAGPDRPRRRPPAFACGASLSGERAKSGPNWRPSQVSRAETSMLSSTRRRSEQPGHCPDGSPGLFRPCLS